MMYCCVPFCYSRKDKGKNADGVSFHEFPCNIELREKWLKNIARKDWLPSSVGRTVVCSLHFHPDDFKVGLKTRRLKDLAVPSVFEGYPKYMQVRRKRERSMSAIDKRNEFLQSILKPKVARSRESGDNEPKRLKAKTHQSRSVQAPEIQVITTCDAAVQVDVRFRNKRSFALQTDLMRIKQMTELRRWKRKTETLTRQVKDLTDHINAHKPDVRINTFQRVMDAERDKDPYAVFIMDQIRNFGVKKGKWSEATVSECIHLRNVSGKGYSQAKRLVRLPTVSTLKRHKYRHINEVLAAVSSAREEPTENPPPQVQAESESPDANGTVCLDHSYIALEHHIIEQSVENAESSLVPIDAEFKENELVMLEPVEIVNVDGESFASYCRIASGANEEHQVFGELCNNGSYLVLKQTDGIETQSVDVYDEKNASLLFQLLHNTVKQN